MKKEIKIECCAGEDRYSAHCLRNRCPYYRRAKYDVDKGWSYVGTGYGNLYGNPSHETYLSRVRENLRYESEKRSSGIESK